MNTNPKQSTGKIQSGAVFRGIVMLFGLFAFIWLPTPEVDATLQLVSPTDGDFVEPVTVFRWTRSDNPAVQSYRLIIAEDPNLDSIDLDLPKSGDSIIAPQVAVRLGSDLGVFEGVTLHWRVIGLDQAGDPVEQSQQVFSFTFFTDQRGFTVITGLVKSDLNQLGLVGARVAVSSSVHAATANSIVETEFNGEYIAIAVSTDNDGVPIPFPIEITSTKDGFKPTTVLLQEAEKVNGVITRDVLMRDDLPLSSSLRLDSPPDGSQPEPVTVFRWARSENPLVRSYRLIIADDQSMSVNNTQLNIPAAGDSIIAPQVAVNLREDLADFRDMPLYWRVIGLDQVGDPVEQSQQVFSFLFIPDQRGFTVITGLVKSDLNQLGLVGARIAVSSARHVGTANNIVETVFNGEYIAIAVTTDNDRVPIPFPIEITSTKEGFQTTTVILQESEKINGTITRNLTMVSDGDSDGISDVVENASSCLDVDDADTDDDGILDGNEDADHDGAVDASETDPCESDTDNDGLLDGTEIGLTAPQGSDTDLNVFIPDADPTTTTNPLDADSDNDGRRDGEEDANHNGRVDAGETDPSFLSAGALPAILSLLLGD